MKHFFLLLIVCLLTTCAYRNQAAQSEKNETNMEAFDALKTDSKPAQVQNYVPDKMVFAHRGTTYWAPEETEASFRWARNIGADYLELDLQKTSDGHLIALHDHILRRTSNVAEVFPERADSAAIYFTLKELRQLDIGTWFNTANPERARAGFVAQKILTFRDVIKIAEGYRLKKGEDGLPIKDMNEQGWTGFYVYEKDPFDKGNRPGLYAETKEPDCEEIIARELTEMGWNITQNVKNIATIAGKTAIANTKARFILQTFALESIVKLEKLLPNIPKCLLLWQPLMADDLEGNYKKAIDFCIENNVHFMGPSITGAPNNYKELNAPWMQRLVRDAGLKIHAYTFDTQEQFEKYGNKVEGVFTNRADLALAFYNRGDEASAEEILDELAY